MNWFPKQPAWAEMEAARVKRREMLDDFRSQTSTLMAGFQAATNIQIQGVGELAAQSAQTRLQAEVKSMQDKLAAQYEKISKLA